MAALNLLLSVAKPTGVWETIIQAFEGGVGSYILAIVLITLVIRVIWAPFDTFNKKINKKNQRIQAKMQPELDKIKAKYGNDKNLVNQKTQEVYKRYQFSMGGSCLFMLVFMALNLTIFFTLFSGLNRMADYKISQEYDYLKYNYANVLQLANDKYDENDLTIFKNYENVTFKVEEKEIADGEGTKIQKYLVAYSGETKLGEVEYKTDFSYKIQVDKTDENGDPVLDENEQPVKEEKTITSDEVIQEYVFKLVTKEAKTDSEGNEIENTDYKGGTIIIPKQSDEEEDVSLKQTIDYFSGKYISECYENRPEKSSFLWIANYWVADSPIKKSIFSFGEYKGEVGNVSPQEETIYNAFMTNLSQNKGRVNGYFILAVLSIGVSFLSMFLSNLGNKKKGEKMPKQPGGKVMMFILPIIMGLFAAFYNSVFAIYLIVSQVISALLAPLETLIINKWDAHDEKKQEEKSKSVVSYRRK